jgi:hypothetical protein
MLALLRIYSVNSSDLNLLALVEATEMSQGCHFSLGKGQKKMQIFDQEK